MATRKHTALAEAHRLTLVSAVHKPVDLNGLLDRIDRGDASLNDLAKVAEALDLPLWVLLVPGLPRENIEHHMRVVRELAEGYLAGRESKRPDENAEASELPEAFKAHLSDQQERAAELESLLTRLAEDDDTPMCIGIAARMAADLQDALDTVTLSKVMAEGSPS